MILTIVTISINYPSREFEKTISSICLQTNTNINFCVVVSKISDKSLVELREKLSNLFLSTTIIANQDTSLYHAMNIALDASFASPVLFLNSGDVFYSNDSVELIYQNFKDGFVNAFSVVNVFGKSKAYCRFSNPSYYQNSISYKLRTLFLSSASVTRLPPHQGIIAIYETHDNKPLRFSQNIDYSADSELIQSLLRQGVVYHDIVVCSFEFGGVSSRPSVNRLRSYLRRGMYLKVVLEPLFMFVFWSFPYKYFSLINSFAGNPSCKVALSD